MAIRNELLFPNYTSTDANFGKSWREPAVSTASIVATARPAPAEVMGAIVIIHRSRLFRDCLRRSLRVATSSVSDFSNAQEWIDAGQAATSIVLIGLPGYSREEDDRQLSLVLAHVDKSYVVATGDSEDPTFIVDLLAKGLRGYIPSSLALDVSIGALQIVHAGGVYVPAACLLSLPRQQPPPPEKQAGFEMFTAKQLAVIDAIRKGKANKTIAYELNMCESTVKVHVRNIMKKMQARNRTQVAFIANKMLTA